MIRHDRTRGVSARSVLMADVKDANATPDTVSVSLHDTPDGDDLASAQLDSAGAEVPEELREEQKQRRRMSQLHAMIQ